MMAAFNRKKLLLLSVSYLIVLGVGMYVGQRSNKHVETDKKKETTEDTTKNKHKETTEVDETLPDGTKRKKVTIIEDTNTEKKKSEEISTHKEETVTVPKKSLHVNALIGLDTSRSLTPVYGASVSKEFIGPVTIGAFELTNGTGGVSVGIAF